MWLASGRQRLPAFIRSRGISSSNIYTSTTSQPFVFLTLLLFPFVSSHHILSAPCASHTPTFIHPAPFPLLYLSQCDRHYRRTPSQLALYANVWHGVNALRCSDAAWIHRLCSDVLWCAMLNWLSLSAYLSFCFQLPLFTSSYHFPQCTSGVLCSPVPAVTTLLRAALSFQF